jgi:hypothetical protein
MHIDRIRFAGIAHVGIAARADSGEAADHVLVHCHCGQRSARTYLGEGVATGALGGLECIEVLVGHQPLVGHLPGPHVDLGHGVLVTRFG